MPWDYWFGTYHDGSPEAHSKIFVKKKPSKIWDILRRLEITGPILIKANMPIFSIYPRFLRLIRIGFYLSMPTGLLVLTLSSITDFSIHQAIALWAVACLLYTSDAADEGLGVDLGGRRII